MLKIPLSLQDHTKGPKDAPITLIEYGDFECSYCGIAYAIIKNILETSNDKIQFVYRHFPLTQIHPHAQKAAETAEFAAKYDKFWQMYDLLFQNQKDLGDEVILSLVQSLSLPLDEYDQAISNRIFLPKVKEDFMGGVESGVNGTPTFYINGERFKGSFENLPLVLQQLTQDR